MVEVVELVEVVGVDEEVVVAVEAGGEVEVREDVAVDDDVLEVVCSAMFHPTTAMAPTVDFPANVVVAIFQALDDPGVVKANVSTAPDVTSERQSPATEPEMPLAR